MDFGIIYQLKTKKFWWLDAIFYFVAAFLLATIICFAIFALKISSQEKKLGEVQNQITTSTGTAQQKEEEKQVFEYQRKIDDFAVIMALHKTPTNIMKLFERTTLPNVWFNSFSLNSQAAEIKITGEAEGAVALSRQMAIFEENELVKSVSSLNSEPTETSRVKFDLGLSVDPNIFFMPTIGEIELEDILETTSPSSSLFWKYVFIP